MLVCDEAVSALDVSTRNQIINLLEDLQADLGMAVLFIAHDLSVVRHISHRVAVMYLGWIVEEGPVERIFGDPAHPYTAALLSAIPVPDPGERGSRGRVRLEGDVPDPSQRPSGCPFRTRCPYVMPICETEEPPATPTAQGGSVRCHLHQHGPVLAGGSVKDLPVHPQDETVSVEVRP
ncbi:MAG: ABC transporter ATP-binding protein [Xanthomonadales bacterium]|nr:ABC transporter ATP-binding protein [Xanthomonadales bacterium]